MPPPRRDLVPEIPTPRRCEQVDRRLWKHYLPATTVAGGNKRLPSPAAGGPAAPLVTDGSPGAPVPGPEVVATAGADRGAPPVVSVVGPAHVPAATVPPSRDCAARALSLHYKKKKLN